LEEFIFASGFIVGVLDDELEARSGITELPGSAVKSSDLMQHLTQAVRAFKKRVFQQAAQTPFY
jgi:hypothetical protein